MSDILVDNWTMQTAATNSVDVFAFRAEPDPDYIRLIEAIVLWDNLYYVENEFTAYWKELLHKFDYDEFIRPITELKDQNIQLYTGHAKELAILDGSDVVRSGALEYCALADQLCMNYLPAGKRMEYLEKNQMPSNTVDRRDIMAVFDRNVLEYYDEINKKIGSNRLRFDLPILFSYIQDHANNATLIETAMKTKEINDVRNFREYLNQVEIDFKQGDIQALDKCLDAIPKLVSSMKKTLKIQLGGSVQISFGFNGVRNS